MDATNTHKSHSLPSTHRALLLRDPSERLSLESTHPTPLPTPGTVIVSPLYTTVFQYANEIFTNGNPRGYKFPLPLIPGGACVARVAAVPSDATRLRAGQLCFVEMTVRARDDANTKVRQGVHEGWTEGTRRLFGGEWRDGAYAQFMKAPMENVHVLDEAVLLGSGGKGLGYKAEELGSLGQLIVPFGGLSDIGVKAGETVLVAPATGSFGGAAVHVALAMGAKVIAMGRRQEPLDDLKRGVGAPLGRLETVVISGDVQKDTDALNEFGPLDVFFDISPTQAAKSSHIKAAIAALRPGGRISMMGGIQGDMELPYFPIMYKGITIKGTYMNSTQQAKDLIKLLERGFLRIGERAGMKVSGTFPLEQWKEAMDLAAKEAGAGRSVYLTPNVE